MIFLSQIIELFRSFDYIIFIIRRIEITSTAPCEWEKEKKIEEEKPIMNYELQKTEKA